MEDVFVLYIEWNLNGDCGFDIKLFSTLEKAQIQLSKDVYNDMQDLKMNKPEGADDFDFELGSKDNLPCPSTYISLSNEEEDPYEYYVDYTICKTPVDAPNRT